MGRVTNSDGSAVLPTTYQMVGATEAGKDLLEDVWLSDTTPTLYLLYNATAGSAGLVNPSAEVVLLKSNLSISPTPYSADKDFVDAVYKYLVALEALEPYRHQVTTGETLDTVKAQYDEVSINVLVENNADTPNIFPPQTHLFIPLDYAISSEDTFDTIADYITKDGDSLQSIVDSLQIEYEEK